MEGDSESRKPFYVDRAKGSRAACKGCKDKCMNDELRMAKVVPSPYGEGQTMKSWFHLDCLMAAFLKQKPTTKRIDSVSDIGNWDNLNQNDQSLILDKINSMEKDYHEKHPGKCTLRVIKKEPAVKMENSSSNSSPTSSSNINIQSKDHSFEAFINLCEKIAKVDAYTAKTSIVATFFSKGSDRISFKGDLTLWCSLLLPQAIKRVYNLRSKQLVKLFARIFQTDHENMIDHLSHGDIAVTIENYFQKSKKYQPCNDSTLSLQEIDAFLQKLSSLTKEDEQVNHFKTIIVKCTCADLRMLIRLIKGDLRINAGPKHILEGVHPDAYTVFQTARDINFTLERVLPSSSNVKPKDLNQISIMSVGAKLVLMTPVLPMLAEACKSVEMAMKKCPNGMFSEIKYDGERVQVHKKGDEFKYFSRALKPVMPHKVNHFKNYLPQAFPTGEDLVLDAEVLMIDVKTGKPLPFGTLGIHKQSEFKDAQVCLYVFDCLFYNGKVLMDEPIRKRRQILLNSMVEVKNHIMFSEQQLIKKPGDLASMIAKVLQLGLEGLVLKDLESKYEPGKRHWLKVKKDYLFDGAMADTADLVVLGAWYGTGRKGGMMSVFLMGCHDTRRDRWVTVTKVHTGHDDKTLEALQKELEPLMIKISQDYTKTPDWLHCNRGLVPDFVARDPKTMPVWEITGTEFTKANIHTADGISVRFPRVTRIRSDKDWSIATNLAELTKLYSISKDKTDVSLLDQLSKTAAKDEVDKPGVSPKKRAKPEEVSPCHSPKKRAKPEEVSPCHSPKKKAIPKEVNTPNDSPKKKAKPGTPVKNRTIDSYFQGKEKSDEKKELRLPDNDKASHNEPPLKKIKSASTPEKKTNEIDRIKSETRSTEKRVKKNSPRNFKTQKRPTQPLPDVFEGLTLAFYPDFVSYPEEDRRFLERHWVGYGGEIVKQRKEFNVDYVIHSSPVIKYDKLSSIESKARHVTPSWLIDCINKKKLCDTRPFAVRVKP